MKKNIYLTSDFSDFLDEIQKIVQETVRKEIKLMSVNKERSKKTNYLSKKQVCSQFNISPSSLYRRIDDGTILCFKIGGRSLFDEKQITESLIKLSSKV